MKRIIRIGRLASVAAVSLGLSISGFAQFADTQQQPDEVDQLAQMVNLSEEQQTQIREVISEITPQIERLQGEAQNVQRELEEHIGPDFDEEEIRETASKLGEMAGEMTALTVILQSRVAKVMTEEQREQLEQRARQQEQMQQQMMQQQLQQQIEEQMRQQQQQPQEQQPQQQQQQQGRQPQQELQDP